MDVAASYVEINKCRICGNPDLVPILNLGKMALTGVFPRTVDGQVTTGPVELVKCDEARSGACGLVQLRQSYRFDEMYGDNYGYRSGLNASMVAHLGRKVRRIAEFVKLRPGDLVVDVGSNDGTLLNAYDVVEHTRRDRVGVDPTGAKFRHHYAPGIRLIEDFFAHPAIDRIGGKARVVTSIAMFYDLETPLDFMSDVRSVLADDGVWVFEQSYLPTMIDRLAYDTICHEHVEFYCLKQIKWLCDKAGFKIVDVELNDVNGGSFSVMVAKREAAYAEVTDRVEAMLLDEQRRGMGTAAVFHRFAERVSTHKAQLRSFVKGARSHGETIYGYGASTKGNVVLQYCGFGPDDIVAVADVNEEKFGRFTPGSRIPIVSEAEANVAQPDYYLVLPWHFRDGFIVRERDYLRAGGKMVFALPELTVVEEV
jgi:NDP-4-keto-2,6-dideoxyhexose 3-C-methyltransferase